jgi:preprotein translocase subunit YajC
MKFRLLPVIAVAFALTMAASAQDAPVTSPTPQTQTQGQRGGHGGRGGWGEAGMGGGDGIAGVVTQIAADHYIIKTDAGETYTIHFSVNTRILKQMIRQRGEGGEGGIPPQAIKPADIKVGDALGALGEVDAAAKSVGAAVILQIAPERARQMREMQASYGKTMLMGKVTAIDETKVTILGAFDNAAHDFVADENTTFRKHREPITLADVHVGDVVHVDGAVKNGMFVATVVSLMGMRPGAAPTLPRDSAPAPASQPR